MILARGPNNQHRTKTDDEGNLMMRNSNGIGRGLLIAAMLLVGLAVAGPTYADTFTLTSCHVTGGCGTATSFGTVTLMQVGTSVTFDVALSDGNIFVETGPGGGELFLFNDSSTTAA